MSSESSTGKKARTRRQRRERGRLHTIQEPSSGIYYIRGTVHGTKVRQSTGTSDATVADAMRVKLEAELLTASVHGRKTVSTFAECVIHYRTVRDGGSNNRWLAPLVEKFGDMKVRDMTPAVIRAYVEERYRGKNVCGATKNVSVIRPLITVLRCAALEGLCDPLVIEAYEEVDNKIMGAPTDWVTEFLSKCDRPKVKAYVALLTTTGCRGVDARRLRSEHVDYEAGTAYLPTTKNDAARTLQIIGPVADLLRSFEHAPDGTVFGYSRTSVSNKEIEKACKRIGMPYYSGHRLGRHAFAERLLNDGQSLQQVMHAGGWSDITTLSKKYGHLEKSRIDATVREKAAAVMRGGLRVVK